jgi:anaerobic magnesium-protoporphyrin IX monomethyl ester cyclase
MKQIFYIGVLPRANLRALGLEQYTTPLGQLILATELKKHNISSIVYDENITDRNIILDSIKDILNKGFSVITGVTITSGNLNNSFEYCKNAKSLGAKVIAGGPEISMAGPRILAFHTYIDSVSLGPAESTIVDIINGKTPEHNYSRNTTIGIPIPHHPPAFSLDFDNIDVDYSLLHDLQKLKGVSYLWGNDCTHVNRRCLFCGRLSMGKGYRPSIKIWNELNTVYQLGINRFYNTTDSITSNDRAFQEFVSQKPLEMTIDSHRVFVNANEITDITIDSLKKLHGVAVIGFESFSLFSKTGKIGESVKKNIAAIDRLVINKIPFVLSFVLGLPGENTDTLNKTIEGVILLVNKYSQYIEAIHLSPLLVTTGSKAYQNLFSIPDIQQKYKDKSFPYDPISTSEDFFNSFCSISRINVLKTANELIKKVIKIESKIKIGLKGILDSELSTFD